MLPLFIVENLPNSGPLEIVGDEAKHAISALRIKAGELISLTDGAGKRAQAQVVQVANKSLIVDINYFEFEAEPKIHLTVVQALTKGDRARETVELLTEAGVDQIIPWSAARSIGQWRDSAEGLDKWRTWARESTKQSRRSRIPKVSPLVNAAQLTEQIKSYDLSLMFHESANSKLSQVLDGKSPQNLLIVIGPEGGLTDEECLQFVSAGAHPVVMGKPVFRSAHAGAAALSAVQACLKVW